jgi:lycopene cyclase domain-containing protein
VTYLHVQLMLLPLLVAGWAHLVQRPRFNVRAWARGVGVLSLIASIWTTPWDNLMVYLGVWAYPPNAVLGTIGYIPIEEQIFFVLQTALTGAWFGLVCRMGPPQPRRPVPRVVGAGVSLVLVGFGGWLIAADYLYLGSTLFWFCLPLALQLGYGADRLSRFGWSLCWGFLPPTILLVMVDALAIKAGTWSFPHDGMVGLYFGPLPLEELVFFAVTNLLVVTGLALWYDLDADRGT